MALTEYGRLGHTNGKLDRDSRHSGTGSRQRPVDLLPLCASILNTATPVASCAGVTVPVSSYKEQGSLSFALPKSSNCSL